MARVQWLGAPRVEWLGAYSGQDKVDNPLTKEIVARKGSTDSKSLEAYGKIGGSLGGGGACLALGVSAPLAGGCAILGGIIGGWIGKQIPVASGSTMEDLVIDTWQNYTGPRAKLAKEAILSVKAYLTMRDLAITQGLATDAQLTSMGLPPAPVNPRWLPTQARRNSAAEFDSFVVPSNLVKECNSASKLGIISSSFTCKNYVYATYFNGGYGPIGKPGDPIDWYAVGRDAVAFYHLKKNKSCWADMNLFSSAGPSNMVNEKMPCPTASPKTIVEPLIAKLNQKFQFKPPGTYTPTPAGSGGGGASPVLVVGGLAVAAAAAWFFL